jgi:hypothetical protein
MFARILGNPYESPEIVTDGIIYYLDIIGNPWTIDTTTS